MTADFRPAYALLALFTSALLLMPPLARAQGAVPHTAVPGQYKIGVVNVKTVFDSYEKQVDEYKDLQDKRDTKQKQIDKLSEKINRNKERYEAEKENMSDVQHTDLEDLIESDYSLYKAEFSRLQEDIDRREKKLLESIFKEIHLAIQEVGAAGNYHLVLEGGETGRSGLLYFSTTLNMTQQIIDYLNVNYKKSK